MGLFARILRLLGYTKKQRVPRSAARWTVAEKALLQTLAEQGVKPAKMHIALPHRTKEAVEIQACRMRKEGKL